VASIAQVEPLTSARALRGPFDYALPEEMRDSVGVGSMLVVPFGRRELLGVVVGLTEASSVARERLLAPRHAVEADVPVDLVELAGWIALEYCSTPARALSLVLPPGSGSGVHGLARLVAELTNAPCSNGSRPAARSPPWRPAPLTPRCGAWRRADSCA
jgi:primosomal protein N' (replication factor Y)